MSPLHKLWQALEEIPGTRAAMAEWRHKLGADLESIGSMLIPTDRYAEILPVAGDPYASYRVVHHSDDDVVGIHDGGGPTITLSKQDVLIYRLDHQRMIRSVAAVLGVKLAPASLDGAPNTYRIGSYRPFAGYAFPVFFTIPLESADLRATAESVTARCAEPFVLLAPTSGHLRPECEAVIKAQKACFLALDDAIDLDGRGRWVASATAQQQLAAFVKEVIPQVQSVDQPIFFPTPPEATWADVKIKFTDGETMSIKVGDATGKYLFSDMGMVDGRNKRPNKQWELLRAFSKEFGTMTWKNPAADKRNQKRREYLAGDLKAFFRIDGDPIVLTDDKKGWRTVFCLEPEA